MLRLLFGAVVMALLLIAGLAVEMHHLWGWKGLVAFPFLLVVILWMAKTLVFKAIRRFAMRLFRMKGAVLEGASVDVHSIRPVTKPEGWDESDEEAADEPEDDEAVETLSAQADESAVGDEEEKPEAEETRHYFEIDLTISPVKANCFRLWTPSELGLTSTPRKGLEELEDDFVSEVCDCQIWDGNKFDEDDAGKYEGAQRVKIVFAVETGLRTVYLNYYGNPLGPISLPEWAPTATNPAAPGD